MDVEYVSVFLVFLLFALRLVIRLPRADKPVASLGIPIGAALVLIWVSTSVVAAVFSTATLWALAMEVSLRIWQCMSCGRGTAIGGVRRS